MNGKWGLFKDKKNLLDQYGSRNHFGHRLNINVFLVTAVILSLLGLILQVYTTTQSAHCSSSCDRLAIELLSYSAKKFCCTRNKKIGASGLEWQLSWLARLVTHAQTDTERRKNRKSYNLHCSVGKSVNCLASIACQAFISSGHTLARGKVFQKSQK